MICFTDASALVKQYVNETGSQWFRSELSNNQLLTAATNVGLQIENQLNQ